jgi:putative drug exporter of the RND superfamily
MTMVLDVLRSVVSRRPGWVVAAWLVLTGVVGALAPDLTRLAAEGEEKLLDRKSESIRAVEALAKAWPDEAYDCLAVLALHRPQGLTESDRAFGRHLAEQMRASGRPPVVLRVLGPDSEPEVAARLVSRDGTVQLLAIPLSSSFVAPSTHEAVAWLQDRARAAHLAVPTGLQLLWTGDAVVGRDYMAAVQTSLDRVAAATVVLLLIVLLAVYRSSLLALIPLATIGISLVISRGVLAWMYLAGWQISSLVELFLVAVLFGTGTDFCLFISWRFAEHFNPHNPGGAMRVTLRRAIVALMTSAGTVIVGLSLMGTTQFQLFSSTGPSVAIGLVITLAATLTLTPALLVLLAKHRPRSFAGLTRASSGYWDALARRAMARPLLSWAVALVAMAPLAILSLRTEFVQDILTELPETTPSARNLRLIAGKFDAGMFAPLTVVLETESNFRSSEGLALLDDVSRLLSRQKGIDEVRSATQPLGSPKPLEPARIASRMREVDAGIAKMREGAAELEKGLTEGAAKLRTALWLERRTGLNLVGQPGEAPNEAASAEAKAEARDALAKGFRRASSALFGGGLSAMTPSPKPAAPPDSAKAKADEAQEAMLRDLSRAAEGAGQIARGAARAHHEVASILADPAGSRALDRLLITPETVRENPELNRSFDAYITRDGHLARVDISQADRVFSGPAMDEVVMLRRKLRDYLGEPEHALRVRPTIAGSNAESADIRKMTHDDQVQSWFLVPIGVFLVLMFILRDPLAGINLVGTMVLTYMFALGATHLVFITILGDEGLDWKVPYFLFVLLVAVGVDYNVFLMDRVRQETDRLGLRPGIVRAIARTGGLISSAAAITACSFASFLTSPLGSLRQLGFALVVGITVDALLVRPLLVPCGHWLLNHRRESRRATGPATRAPKRLAAVPD